MFQGLAINEPPRPSILSAAPKEKVAAESKLTVYTAKEIAEIAPDEPEWLVRPYVVKGAITDINGKAKAGGKTTFVSHLCRRVLDGEPFMDLPTLKTAVMYLTEQSATTFREVLGRAGLLEREDFAVVLWRDTIGVNWPEIAREAAEEAVRRGAELLVVDTLPQFAGLKGDGENSATAALSAMQPIQEAAATHNLAIIIVRHERESGGQVGDSGRGSSAFAGAVDLIVSIKRVEGNIRPSVRELHAISRFDETPDMLVVELTEDGYKALGDKAAVAESEAREAILEAAPTSEAVAVSLNMLLMVTDLGRTTAQKAIEALLEAGELRRVGEGKKGSPYRYWRPSSRPGPEADLPSEERTITDHENGMGNPESAESVSPTGGPQEGGTVVTTDHGNDGDLTEIGKPKMGILEYGPDSPRRYGLDNLHLAHPVLGAILWSDLPYAWQGSLVELLEILNANVEDRVKEVPEWPSSPRDLYEYLLLLDGFLFPLFGGDIALKMQGYSEERPEETRVEIELVFPDEFEEDDPEGDGELYTELDFDWIAPEDRDEG